MLRILLAALLASAVPLVAPAAETAAPAATADKPLPQRTLDELYAALSKSADAEAAAPLESEILRRQHKSGSDTTDLLMGWAMQAMQGGDNGVALDLLDRVVVMTPGYAEGWNKRATVHFMMKDYGKSLSDIERTLALEPRHFGALVGLGYILRDIDDKERAAEILRRALAVHPHLKNAREVLDELEKETGGREI